MKAISTLPQGYKNIYTLNLKKDKIVSMHFVVPIFSFFDMSEGLKKYLIRFITWFVLSILYLILHELVHGIAMKICGTKKVKYGYTGLYAFAGSDDYYDIKRVVGVPGDTVSVVAGRLVINGKHTSDDLPYSFINSPGVLSETVTLGDEEYFVLGDNTSNSEDSRYINYGNVQKSEIKGKITYRLSPKDKRGKVK